MHIETHTHIQRIAQRRGNSSLLLHDLVMHKEKLERGESEGSQEERSGTTEFFLSDNILLLSNQLIYHG